MAVQFEPFECMMTHSTCYRNTWNMEIKGVLWHSTGANNPWLKRYVQPYEGDKDYDKKIAKLGVNRNKNDWNHIDKRAGLNCWIGKFDDGSVGTVQTMPWNFRPWGCGTRYDNGPSCNDGWIQFEICEDDLKDKDYAKAVWDEAVKFTAWICEKYGLDPLGTTKHKSGKSVPVILDHKTSWELGLGSGHGDIRHWFPKILGKDMADARKEVYGLLHHEDTPKELDGFTVGKTYVVICKGGLNIRTMSTVKSNTVGVISKGTEIVCKALNHDTDGNTWLCIDSGWICGIYKGQTYVAPVEWVKKDGKWYYYGLDGVMVTNQWIQYKKRWYYVGSDGVMLYGWQKIDGAKYYMYPGEDDGHMASFEWIDGLWIGKNGKQDYPYIGEWKTDSKGRWWEDTSGYYPVNKTERIDMKNCTFDKKGYLIEG